MTRRRLQPQHRDSGAALLLAIGTVLLVGALGAGLTAAATSSLNNRSTLEQVRDREYAADGSIEQSIAILRGSAQFQTTCAPSSASMHGSELTILNNVPIRVDWTSTCSKVNTYDQRNVVLSACLDTPNPPCAPSDVIVKAQVNFEPANGPVTKTFVQSWSVNR